MDRREAVLTATQAALAAHGIAGLRMAEVAAAAGVSVGAIQHHFADRDEMITEAFARHELRTVEALREAGVSTGDSWADLTRLLTAFRGFEDTTVRARMWIALAGASLVDERWAALIRRIEAVWEEILGDVVRRGVEDGIFRPRLSEGDIVVALVRLADGYTLVQVADPTADEWTDPRTVSTRFIDLARVLLDPDLP